MYTFTVRCPEWASKKKYYTLPVTLIHEERKVEPFCPIPMLIRTYEYSKDALEFLLKFEKVQKVNGHPVWLNNDVAIKIYNSKKKYQYTCKIQTKLAQYNICPPIINTFERDYGDFYFSKGEYIIVSKYVGQSLLVHTQKQGTSEAYIYEDQSGKLVGNLEPHIMNKVLDLSVAMKKLGYHMSDFHAENFTIDDHDNVWGIDCGSIKKLNRTLE